MNMTVGSFFKLCREIKDVSLRDVERETNISNAYLSQIEGGKIVNPSFKIIYTLCKFYNVNMERFIELTNPQSVTIINPENIKSGDILIVKMKARYNQNEQRFKDVVHVVSSDESVDSASKTVKIDEIVEHIRKELE